MRAKEDVERREGSGLWRCRGPAQERGFPSKPGVSSAWKCHDLVALPSSWHRSWIFPVGFCRRWRRLSGGPVCMSDAVKAHCVASGQATKPALLPSPITRKPQDNLHHPQYIPILRMRKPKPQRISEGVTSQQGSESRLVRTPAPGAAQSHRHSAFPETSLPFITMDQ